MQNDLDNKSKPWDTLHRQLFHRIQSDKFDKDRAPANGRAYEAGARSPADFKESTLSDVLLNGVLKAIEGVLTGPLGKLLPAAVVAIVKQFDQNAGNFLQDKLNDLEDKLAKLLANTLEGLLFAKFLRSIPSWVPVERKGHAEDDKDFEKNEQEREIEGELTCSFQMPRDIPFFQWSHWYHWAFHVRPIDGYAYVRGQGNIRNPTEVKALNPDDANDPLDEATDVNLETPLGHSVACMMDIGAFSAGPGNFGKAPRPTGPMFRPEWPFWPTCGDYFWTVGRWVYDCTHTDSNHSKGANQGIMPTQINPIKAWACARYEGFKFPENEGAVPAARFMFFASRLGGHLNCSAKDADVADDECGVRFNDQDYVFILDLPEAPDMDQLRWPIGHHPIADANTLVLRPSLLIDLQMAPFGISGDTFRDEFGFDGAVAPKVQLLKPQDPKKPTQRQVKVTVPMTNVNAKLGGYGFCLTLGWFDPTGEQADRVRKVQFTWDTVQFLDDYKRVRMNIGVNGRWLAGTLGDVSQRPVPLSNADPRLAMFVPDDGVIRVAAHAIILNGFGRFMEDDNDEDRKLHVGGIFRLPEDIRKAIEQGKDIVVDFGGNLGILSSDFLKNISKEALDLLAGKRVVVEWKKHIDQKDDDIAASIAREMFAKLPPIFNDQNEPIALVEPSLDRHSSDLIGVAGDGNPIQMSKIVKFFPDQTKQFTAQIQARKTEVVGDADKLVFHSVKGGAGGMVLNARLDISPQS